MNLSAQLAAHLGPQINKNATQKILGSEEGQWIIFISALCGKASAQNDVLAPSLAGHA